MKGFGENLYKIAVLTVSCYMTVNYGAPWLLLMLMTLFAPL